MLSFRQIGSYVIHFFLNLIYLYIYPLIFFLLFTFYFSLNHVRIKDLDLSLLVNIVRSRVDIPEDR